MSAHLSVFRALGVDYLTAIPAPDVIPPGQVVVHNHVVPPVRRLGVRGFRAWLAPPSDQLALCECGWAPALDPHYRVVRDAATEEQDR